MFTSGDENAHMGRDRPEFTGRAPASVGAGARQGGWGRLRPVTEGSGEDVLPDLALFYSGAVFSARSSVHPPGRGSGLIEVGPCPRGAPAVLAGGHSLPHLVS